MTGRATGRAAEKRGLLLAFAAFGVFWGSWSALLPDVQRRAGIDDRVLRQLLALSGGTPARGVPGLA